MEYGNMEIVSFKYLLPLIIFLLYNNIINIYVAPFIHKMQLNKYSQSRQFKTTVKILKFI